MIVSLGLLHAVSPDTISFLVEATEQWLNIHNLAVHRNEALGFDAEAGHPMPRQFSHHVSGSDLLHRDVSKLQRRQVLAADLPLHEHRRTDVSDIAFGAVAVSRSPLNAAQQLHTAVSRLQFD